MSNTADWHSKARVKINFTIRERFQKLIMNPGRASSIFNMRRCLQNLGLIHDLHVSHVACEVQKIKEYFISSIVGPSQTQAGNIVR